MARSAWGRSSAMMISLSALRAPAWTLLGSAPRMLRTLWTLCGYPHNVHYAEHRIMLSGCRGALRDRGLVLMESA